MTRGDRLIRSLVSEAASYKRRFEQHLRSQGYMVCGWEDDKMVVEDNHQHMLWAYPGCGFTPYTGSKFKPVDVSEFTTVTPREYP